LAEYRQALRVAKSDAAKGDALYGMARAQQELKLYDAAADSYRRLAQEFPSSRFAAASLRSRARALTQAGRKQEAKQAWQELSERGPKEPGALEAQIELGLLWQQEGEYRKAIEHFGRAVTQGQPEVAARAQYEIGRSYTLLKDRQQGTLELLKVAYLYPEQKRWVQPALFQAAANYEQERKWGDALAVYQKIVKEIATREAREQASQKIEQLKKKMGSGA
jgi:tetratricopeptide (TPR) repeat protein